MTENKHFVIDVADEIYENAFFEDGKFVCLEYDYDEILKKFNELADENEQLKSHINDTEIAVEIETEKCMQKVFDWIDEKLREEKKAIEDMGEDYDDYYHLGKLDILNKMKEELQE